jgi:hypothetical protein
MTRAAKIVYLTMLALGLGAGIVGGFWTRMSVLGSLDDSTRSTAPSALRDFCFLQYRYADPAHAKAAARMTVSFLRELEEVQRSKEQEAELAASYTRLAVLADQDGDSEQSQAQIQEARRWHAKGAGRDYSDAEMKAWLKARDDLTAAVYR